MTAEVLIPIGYIATIALGLFFGWIIVSKLWATFYGDKTK